MASRRTVRTRASLPDSLSSVHPDPQRRPGYEPEPVDRLILAAWRADQLATLLATRLDDIADTLEEVVDDVPAATQAELHALSLCAVQIRQCLADVTRHAGAYV